ncbi:Cro/Cl family transcriptional regulator [Companilactobacillus sp. RD055328]|uniref:metal-dependent transcriptional regulator n=1 Tax=Companilactobacillus sp. RD055328 TaxID=2916634 RepID=UPI001FC7E585|nr:metal-dependent transcriptional regulator [Companilactobacillus sp. RD055328]GKQ43208.1 Cro/Cl family transcriptional regulator [Companilactobacillus sp. RD055328]
MSPNKENYLKVVYELTLDFRKVNNKNIALIMNVSAASVTEMLSSLAEDGLIDHKPYNEITLTKAGQKVARELVKRHRIWEVFLSKKLNYEIDTLHEISDQLEHTADADLIERLNEFLNFPIRCPHGGLVPGNVKKRTDDDTPLTDYDIGAIKKIHRVVDNHEFLKKFKTTGLTIGEEIKIIDKNEKEIIVESTEDGAVKIPLADANFIFLV